MLAILRSSCFVLFVCFFIAVIFVITLLVEAFISPRRLADCKFFFYSTSFKRLSLIVRVNVVLNRTVVVDSY